MRLTAPRRVLPVLFALVLALCLSACEKNSVREIRDRSGRTARIYGPVHRIISTAPSNTEIIVDLGMAKKLIAVDRHSADIAGIPEGLPVIDFFYPDAEVIAALKPDLILAHGHNATGSGSDPFALLEEMGISVAYISMSRSINGIYEDIAFVAGLLEVPGEGERLIRSMKTQIEEITRKLPAAEPKPTVYFEISPAPEIFTFGKDSYLNDMISVIGARNIFEHDEWILSPGAESIIQRNPDVIMTNVNFIADPRAELKNRPGFDHISAVINNRVYLIDTNSSVRPSSRIILALRQMARAVYPEAYEN
jgi:iron complex transport system substrate-binding protein